MTHLIGPDALRELLLATNLEELVELLSVTDYGAELRKLPKLSADATYEAFAREFKRRVEYLYSISPKRIKEFLVGLCRKYEAEAVAQVLRTKLAGAPTRRPALALSFSKVDFENLTRAEDLREAFEIVRKCEDYAELERDALERSLELESPLPLEWELKRIAYESALEASRKLPRADGERVERLVRIEAELDNCFIALSPLLYGLSSELASSLLIPLTHRLSLDALKKVPFEEERDRILELLKPYREIIEKILERDEVSALALARRMLRRILLKDKIEFSTSPYYLAIYLKECEFEFHDLSLIAYAIQYSLPVERVLKLLTRVE